MGLGGLWLVDVLKRVAGVAECFGIWAVTVHALNDAAKRFYEVYGFLPLLDDPRHLFMPMTAILKL